MRIKPDAYRLISGAVSEEGVRIAGETIPITPENSGKVQEAVSALIQEACQAHRACG